MRKRLLFLFLLAASTAISASASEKPSFVVGWSVYVGWTPWSYLSRSGLLKKWADKYNVNIRVQRFDYAPSLDAFVAKNIDACAMTNMEALDMPAAAGIDTTAIITGDYSNGNDALLTRRGLNLQQLSGKKMLLVEKTVSEYLFERAMTLNGLESQIKKVKLVNTSDSDIATAFIADNSQDAVVTWKPMVSQIAKTKGVTEIFDSSKIPGEILDLMVVRTDVLNRPDGSGARFAKALAGAWYELMKMMSARGPETDKVLARNRGRIGGHARVLQRAAQHDQSFLHAAIRRRVHDRARFQDRRWTWFGSSVSLTACWERTQSRRTKLPSSIRMERCRATRIAYACAST